MLLLNTQFPKMFTDVYLESDGRFTDKRSIFALAVERLAKDVTPDIPKASVSLSVA